MDSYNDIADEFASQMNALHLAAEALVSCRSKEDDENALLILANIEQRCDELSALMCHAYDLDADIADSRGPVSANSAVRRGAPASVRGYNGASPRVRGGPGKPRERAKGAVISMRLCDFILANVEPILVEWEAFARSLLPDSKMDSAALRDHAEAILLATAHDMRSAQTTDERSAKSKGRGRKGEQGVELNGVSELHALDRLGAGLNLQEVVAEYRALRASVLRLWNESDPAPEERDVDELTRFNESIDQSVTKAVDSYTKRVNQSRDLFLAILGHDLRNPLNSIAASAAMLAQPGLTPPESAGTVLQITTNADVMGRMISDLLDYTRTRLGAGMPVEPAPMDLGDLARALFDEFRTAHPSRRFRLQVNGDLRGDWDADRLRQAVSNLLGNAVQHGKDPIELRLDGTAGPSGDVAVVVHNAGPPIPAGELSRIFDPLVRGSSAQAPRQNRPGSIGLGLYIAREIARSHGGHIDVTSSADVGTAFTVRLPRHHLGQSGQPVLGEAQVRRM